MLKGLLLLVLCLDLATSICFLNETSTEERKVVDRPKVLDEYHCKIICTEWKECLSYVYHQRQCTINGEPNNAKVGAKPHQEWVKKTNDSICPETFKQPLIDAGYLPNPALARGAAKVNSSKLNTNLYDCTDGALMDTLLPDNSHVVQGAMSWIEWDGRLGSWKFIKLMQRGMLGRPGKTYYVRAAQCFEIDPTKFSATSSCAKLPDISIGNVPGREGPVQKYGQLNYCPHKFRFIPDFFDVTIVNGEVQYNDRPADKSFVTCIDGAWMLFDRTFGQQNRINFVAKFTNGTCVK